MNATDFIKQHGVDKARKVINGAPKWAMSINFNNGMYYSRMEHKKGDTFLYDIKRLVESVDLINSLGGLGEAKEMSENPTWLPDDSTKQLLELDQAIADYESIYSGEEH